MSVKTPGQIHPFIRVSACLSSNLSVHSITFSWLLHTLLRDDAYLGECRSEFSVLQQRYRAENRNPVNDARLGIVVQRK